MSMPKPPAILGLCDAMKKKGARREQFLAETDAVVHWTHLQSLINPQYPKVGPKGGRAPLGYIRTIEFEARAMVA